MNMFGLFNKSAADLSEEIAFLNSVAGTWPPTYKDLSQEKASFQRWKRVIAVAQKAYEREETEETLCDLIELFRIGHNMGVQNSAQNADQGIERCLEVYPNSFRGNLIASYFFLSIDPKFAPKGEACLEKLKQLSNGEPCKEAERGLVFAYLYQNHTNEAIEQAETYLKYFGDDEQIKELLEGMKNGSIDLVKRN